jgi:sugar lactone lactonase YvrE
MFVLHSLADMIRTPRATSKRWPQSTGRRHRSSPLRLELLEARNLLSTYTVNPLSDSPSSSFIYWTDQNPGDIRRANLDGTGQQTLVTGAGSPTQIALDVAGGKMYWTDQASNILRANLDGTGRETVVSGQPDPVGIALDVTVGKVYWTDIGADDIRRANLDGTGQQTLVTGQPDPVSLALDVAGGKMYWTNPYSAGDIRRANLDGTGQQILVTGQNAPFAIALDAAGGKMYWTDDFGGDIRRANLDGTGQQTLVAGLPRPVGIALDVAGNSMYWTDFDGKDIRRASLDGTGQQALVTGLPFEGPVGVALQLEAAPTVTCSVADSVLWPPNHQLVNVGLSVDVQPPDATLQVQVYANDNANASDAADIGPDTLQLRAERQGNGSGRVYLIVVTATSGGQTAFDVCTVVVPHDQSADSIATVQAEASAAEEFYRQFQTAPPDYALLGEGPSGADGNGGPNARVSVAGFGQALGTSQGPSTVLANTISATVLSAASPALVVQPSVPALSETVPAHLPLLDARHAQDAVFDGWDTVTDGQALNWT